VLLIDDVQFIAGKERSQDELFHTFNALHDSQRQIVVTSDKFPKDIPGLEERLRSRFEWGLIADIQPPDLETRVAILKKKAEQNRLRCPDDVAMFIASSIKSNVRELEGSLIRVNAFASLANAPITVDFTREVLSNLIREKEHRLSIESVQKAVANHFKVGVSDLKSPRRVRTLAHPRQIAMYLCKKHTQTSYPEIGGKFGGKDHTTVMHACRKIERLLKEDDRLASDIATIERSLTH
jgi:chromosomal replication initiator protein